MSTHSKQGRCEQGARCTVVCPIYARNRSISRMCPFEDRFPLLRSQHRPGNSLSRESCFPGSHLHIRVSSHSFSVVTEVWLRLDFQLSRTSHEGPCMKGLQYAILLQRPAYGALPEKRHVRLKSTRWSTSQSFVGTLRGGLRLEKTSTVSRKAEFAG